MFHIVNTIHDILFISNIMPDIRRIDLLCYGIMLRLLWNKFLFAIYFYWKSLKLLTLLKVDRQIYKYTSASFSPFDMKSHCRNLFLCTFFSFFCGTCAYERFKYNWAVPKIIRHMAPCVYPFFFSIENNC